MPRALGAYFSSNSQQSHSSILRDHMKRPRKASAVAVSSHNAQTAVGVSDSQRSVGLREGNTNCMLVSHGC